MKSFIKERTVTLMSVLKDSQFAKINANLFGGASKPVGASARAQRIMSGRVKLLKELMPSIVGVESNNPAFLKLANKYFIELDISVPVGGHVINASLNFDLSDERTEENISELSKTTKIKFSSAEVLADYVCGFDNKSGKINIEEHKRYLYGTPIKPADYISYLYLLEHKAVTTKREILEKTNSVKFYLVTSEEIKLDKINHYKKTKEVRKILTILEEKSTQFMNMCIMLNIDGADEIDKRINLELFAEQNPKDLIEAYNDKNLNEKAEIINMINLGVLKRVGQSKVIVDAKDASIVIGNNIEQAVTYFNMPDKDNYVNELRAALKGVIANLDK